MMVPFNKPYLTGKEAHYLYQAVESGKISGNGVFTKKCHAFFEKKYSFIKCLLTTSCTDALEMASLLINLQPGDEVIMPSYTFVSTANAFVLRGATIAFADSYPNNPNINPEEIEALITDKTRAIVVVHYAGIACDMDPILEIAKKYNLYVIEDAAQAIESYYKGRPLGGIGEFGAFSFHETKNIISGEGGMLSINKDEYNRRAEIIWEKGTNRAEFFRGEVNKYEWVDVGSSFLPSEITAAFLFAQIESMEAIQQKRLEHWERYSSNLKSLGIDEFCSLPTIPPYATNNAHMYYLVLKDAEARQSLIKVLQENGFHAVSHYHSLHKSTFYSEKHDGRKLPNCTKFAEGLLRLPLFYELDPKQIDQICDVIGKELSK